LTSIQATLPGYEADQIAVILPQRDDNAIYQGTLTFTSSQDVEVVILQNFANETAVDAQYYGNVATAQSEDGAVAISLLTPQFGPIASASIPFAGNALALHNLEGDPFAATYTVSGNVAEAQTYNAITPPPLAEATGGVNGDGNIGDGDNNDNNDNDDNDNDNDNNDNDDN
jgi:hypothetical protein